MSWPSSDIYALACVLHECLTGQPPFGGDSVQQQIASHLMAPPPAPSEIRRSVPAGFDDVIDKGMAKDPNARYRTALELADAARHAVTASTSPIDVHAAQPQTQMADRGSDGTAPDLTAARSSPSMDARPLVSEWPAGTRSDVERGASRPRHQAAWVGAVAGAAVLALVGLVVVVLGKQSRGDDSAATVEQPPSSSTTLGTPESPSTRTQYGLLPAFKPPADLGANCQYTPTAEPAAKTVDPPRPGKVPTEPATVAMTITTNQGPLDVQLDNAKAPCTVNNFVSLAQKGYYDNTSCHRLTTDSTLSVLQCGDPKRDGSGGPGYQFADEYPTNQYSPNDAALSQAVIYPRGALAMANAGPGTNGSQFFMVYKDSTLPPSYTVFGTVGQTGMGVLDKVAAAGTADGAPDGKPKTDVVITSARLD